MASNISLLSVYSNITYTSNYILETSNQIINYAKSLSESVGNSVWNDNGSYTSYSNVEIRNNMIKISNQYGINVYSYINYDFSENPLSTTTLINKGTGTTTMNGTITNSPVSLQSSNYPSFANHSSNLMVWYKFDDNSTNMLNDSSGNSYTLTNIGTCLFDNTSYIRGNGSVSFNGSSYLSKSVPPSTTNYFNPSVFTVCCWVYKTTSATIDWQCIARSRTGTSSGWAIFHTRSSQTLEFWFGSTVHNTNINIENKWCHITFVYKGTSVLFYYNGILNNIFTNSSGYTAGNTSLFIGRDDNGGGNWNLPNGSKIDDFRMYNRELTANEIKQVCGGFTLTITTEKPNYLIPYSYYWNGLTTDSGDNAYITIPKAGVDPIISSTNLSVYYWLKSVNTSNTFSVLNLKKNTSNSYLDIIHDKTDIKVKIYNVNDVVKYPRETLSANTKTYADGTIVKCRESSTNVGLSSHRQFDNDKNATGWESATYYEPSGSNMGYHLATRSDYYFKTDSSFTGEYAIIDLGENIILKEYKLYPYNIQLHRAPLTWRIYATNDTASYDNTKSSLWVLIDERTNISGWVAYTSKNFILSPTPIAYRYYAIIINKIQNTGTQGGVTNIANFELYGYPPSTPVYNTTFTNTISTNTWDNYALTFSYTDPTLAVSLYKNGVVQSGTGTSLNISTFGGFPTDANAFARIGDNSTGADPSPSYLADFRLYNSALSSTDIVNNYNLIHNSVDNLHIHNSSTAQNVSIRLTDGTTGDTLLNGSVISKDPTSAMQIWNYENAPMYFGTSNTERMRITADGKVGIGTIAPVDDLHIHNSLTSQNVDIRLTDGTTGATITDGSLIRKNTASELQIWNYENADMYFGTSNTERMRILANGNIGIGTTLNFNLDVYGNTNILSGKMKISNQYGINVYSYINYDFSEIPLGTNTLINKGTGTTTMNGTITNSLVSPQSSNYPSFANHEQYLLAWYKFDGDLNDSSVNKYHLSYKNIANNGSVTYDSGIRGSNCVKFNLTALTNTSINVSKINFCICFWMKSSINTWIVSQGQSGNGKMFHAGYFGTYNFNFQNDDLASSSYASDANTWVHICFNYNYNTKIQQIYRNGINIAQRKNTYDVDFTPTNFTIGSRADITNTSSFYNGYLDDFRVYNKELSPEEVQQVYGSTLTRITDTPNILIPYSYYWNGLTTDSGDNAYITIPKAGVDPIISSTNLSVYYWLKSENTSNTFSVLNLKKNTSNSYLDIIHDKTDIKVKIYNVNDVVKYPRETLSANTKTYADGTIVKCRESSAANTTNVSYRLFEGTKYSNTWLDNRYYEQSLNRGNHLATRSDYYFKTDSSFTGEYAIIDLGENIILKEYYLYPPNTFRAPLTWRIYATNDTASYDNTKSSLWVLIDERTNITGWVNNNYINFILSPTPIAYRYYAIIVNKVQNNTDGYLQIAEWELYGYPPSTPYVYNTTFTNTLSTNTWDNYALTFRYTDPTLAVSLYKNGVVQSGTGTSLNISTFGGFPTDANAFARIGDNSTGTDPSPSYLADFRLYNSALSSTEIVNNYNLIDNSVDNLHIHNSSTARNVSIRLTDGTTGDTPTDGSVISKDPTSAMQIWNYENAPMYFGTSNTERMRITADGKVGIGTTAPVDDLHIHNSLTVQNVDIRLTDGTTGATITDGSLIRKNTASELQIWNYENADIFFGTRNTERMRILENGNIGIGTTPNFKLDVYGDANISSGKLKISNQYGINVYSYINYDFSENPLSTTTLINKGTGTTSMNGTITNSLVSPQSSNYPSFANHEQYLLAWYKFDGDLNDSSVNKYHLSYRNIANNGSVTYDSGIRGSNCVKFNLTNLTNTSMNVSKINFCICFWMKSSNNTWIVSQGTASAGKMLHAGYDSLSRYNFAFFNDDMTSSSYASDANTWVHICFNYNYNTKIQQIYRNGINIAQRKNTYDVDFTPTNFTIGGRVDNTNSSAFYNGYLDDFRVYNKELSPEEVQQVYGGKTLLKTIDTPNTLIPYSYYWNGLTTDSGDNAYITIPKAGVDPIISSTNINLSVYYWLKSENTSNTFSVLNLKKNTSNSYLDIIHDKTDIKVKIYDVNDVVKYPRETLSANTTNITKTYADGTIVQCRESSAVPYVASALFNGNKYGNGWNGSASYQSSGSNMGYHLATRSDYYFKTDSSFTGEYAIIDLGENIILKEYYLYPLDSYLHRAPLTWRIYATNDTASYDNTKSSQWVLIDERTNITGWTSSTSKNFILSPTPIAYRYYAIIVNKVQNNAYDGYVGFGEWELYGYPPSTPVYNTTFTNKISTNTWDNYALTFSYTNPTLAVSLYKNGVGQSGTGTSLNISTFSFPTDANAFARIGDNSTGADPSPSYLADFRLYNSALSSTEIVNNYNLIHNSVDNLHIHNSSTTRNVSIRLTDGTTGDTPVDGSVISKDPTSAMQLWNYENAPMYFGTSNTERMRILANGNVGIGTTNPASEVTIHYSEVPTSTSNLNDPKTILQLNRAGTTNESYNSSAYFNLCRWENSGLNSRTKLDINMAHGNNDSVSVLSMRSDGIVGIGTNAPRANLDLYSSSSTSMVIRSGSQTSDAILYLGTPVTTDSALKCAIIADGINSSSRSSLHFCLDNTADSSNLYNASVANSRMTILADGKVGIGTTNPTINLTINYSEVPTSSTVLNDPKAILRLNRVGTSGQSDDAQALFKLCRWENVGWNPRTRLDISLANQDFTSDVLSLRSDGKVGIGGITEPRANLDLYSSSSTSMVIRSGGQTSDAILYLGTPATTDSALKCAIIADGINSSSRSSLHFCLDNTADSSNLYNASVANSRMTILANGNVGIGITNPSEKLSINYSEVPVSTSNLNDPKTIFRLNRAGDPGIRSSGTYFNICRWYNPGPATDYQANTRLDILLINGWNEDVNSLSLRSDGKIGIGTTNPITNLDIFPARYGSSSVAIRSSGKDHNANLYFGTPETTDSALKCALIAQASNSFSRSKLCFCLDNTENSSNLYNASVSNARMTILADGKVGIGTTNPVDNLHIHDSLSQQDVEIKLTDANTGTSLTDGSLIRKNTNHQLQIWNFENRDMFFGTNNTERMRILADGKVGIGNTAPVDDLHLHNSLASQNVSLRLTDSNSGSNITDGSMIRKDTNHHLQVWNFENKDMFFGTNNTERIRILADGKVGIGKTPTTYLLDVNGTIGATGYTTVSDYRIKKNIQDVNDDSALQKILALEPKTYNFIDEKERGSDRVYGFLSQQVKEVIPEAIKFSKNVIPNIYKNCDCSSNIIYLDNTSNLFINDTIYITDTDNTGEKQKYEILEVNENSIIINKEINYSNCFVYGKDIDDFHSLDESYIYTINVCATQELHRRIEAQQITINNLTSNIEAQQNMINILTSNIEAQQNMINNLVNIITTVENA